MFYLIETINENTKLEKDLLIKVCKSQFEAELFLLRFLSLGLNAYISSHKPKLKHEAYEV